MKRVPLETQQSCGHGAVCDFDNLYAAHVRARCGKMRRREVVEFELSLSQSLVRLREELLRQAYGIAGHAHFVVTDPKRRDVYAPRYRDRVVRHALRDEVLAPVLEPRLVYDYAASRRGKGTHFALDRLAGFLRDFYRSHGTGGCMLKFDVRSCYRSIDHAILKRLFDRCFYYDPRVRWLIGRVIDSFADAPGKGIPLGNQASSWFAISYLDGLDRLVKERQRLKRYSRYMDDGVAIHEDRDCLRQCLAQMRDCLRDERALELDQKTRIVPLSQGVDYLGFRLCVTDTGRVVRRLRTGNKRRVRRKLRRHGHAYREGKIGLEDASRSVRGYMAHLDQGDCRRPGQNLLGRLVPSRPEAAEGREVPDA